MATTFERIQLNRKTAAQWTASNIVLLAGEAGVETDTHKVKFGDGTTTWAALPYAGAAAGVATVNGRAGTVTLTAADVGLSNVTNTSDANKPVSTAQAAALASKADYPPGGVNGQKLIKSGTTTAWATDGTVTSTSNSQTGTAYTLALTDVGNIVEQNSATVLTVTVPTNASTPVPIGSVVELFLYGTGSITVASAAGVTVRSTGNASRLTGQYASAALRKRAADEWVLTGQIVV